jgi:hypothetical protein
VARKSGRKAGPKPGNDRAERKAAEQAERAQRSGSARPFAGLAAECDLVALREFVPSATATVALSGVDRDLRLATVLPGAVAALVRAEDGADRGLVAVQTTVTTGDLGEDLARALAWAGSAEAGTSLESALDASEAPALTELVDAAAPLQVTVHDDFAWWFADEAPAPEVAAALEQANAAIMPTARLEGDGLAAAWWVDAGERAHLRWVRPEPEDDVMAALARVHAAGGLTLGDGSRYAGSFRAHGLLVPVFDLDRESHAQEWVTGTQALGRALDEALADDSPLTPAQRRSRDGLRTRQVTIR